MKQIKIPSLDICKKHCNSAYKPSIGGTIYFIDDDQICLKAQDILRWSGLVFDVINRINPDWVTVAQNGLFWPCRLIDQIWSLENGGLQTISDDLQFNLFDDEVTKKIELCVHPRKYQNGIGSLVFWVCPDCKEEVK